jgi:hypothetical protein
MYYSELSDMLVRRAAVLPVRFPGPQCPKIDPGSISLIFFWPNKGLTQFGLATRTVEASASPTTGGRGDTVPDSEEGLPVMSLSLDEVVNNHSRKTVLKTFRFSEDLMCSLENEAKEEGTTINALVNTVITQHLEWEIKARRFGYTPMYKPLLRVLIESLDEESLAQTGKVIPDMWKEMAEFWFQDSSGEKILDFLSFRSRYVPQMQAEVRRADHKHMVVYHHDLGPKWSFVMQNALDELVRRSFRTPPAIDTGETVVTALF